MKTIVSLKEWEMIVDELNELQDMLWHSANRLSDYDLIQDSDNVVTEDQKFKYRKECFDFHLKDGWERLMKIRKALIKLGMPEHLRGIRGIKNANVA